MYALRHLLACVSEYLCVLMNQFSSDPASFSLLPFLFTSSLAFAQGAEPWVGAREGEGERQT